MPLKCKCSLYVLHFKGKFIIKIIYLFLLVVFFISQILNQF